MHNICVVYLNQRLNILRNKYSFEKLIKRAINKVYYIRTLNKWHWNTCKYTSTSQDIFNLSTNDICIQHTLPFC